MSGGVGGGNGGAGTIRESEEVRGGKGGRQGQSCWGLRGCVGMGCPGPEGPAVRSAEGRGEGAVGLTLGPCHTGPPAQSQQGYWGQPWGQRHVQVSSG